VGPPGPGPGFFRSEALRRMSWATGFSPGSFDRETSTTCEVSFRSDPAGRTPALPSRPPQPHHYVHCTFTAADARSGLV
jgi:hypothetical protein